MELRPVTREDMGAFVECLFTAFHLPKPTPEDVEAREVLRESRRLWAVFDGPKVAGTYVSFDTEVTLPGGVPVLGNAISGITTMPTHRRRGVLTSHITRDLTVAREAGYPLAILVAAEWQIYGRFGFGAAGWLTDWTLDAEAPWRGPEPPGTVEFVDATTMASLAPAVYDAHRRASVGEIARTDSIWEIELGLRPWSGSSGAPRHLVIGRDERGAVDGYLWFSVGHDDDDPRPAVTATIRELHSTTPAAAERLWRFCAAMDWVRTVKAERRSVDEPLPHWLVDGRQAQLTGRFDLPWIRPVDVAALLTARRYDRDDSLVIEVVDHMGLSSGRWKLDASTDGATCKPSKARADVTIEVGSLGATVLGGNILGPDRYDVDEHRAGATQRLARLLRSDTAPWCSTWF